MTGPGRDDIRDTLAAAARAAEVRMWLVAAHGLIAVPVWAWLYVAKVEWIYGLFAIAHAVLTGIAVGVLIGERMRHGPGRAR